MNTITIYLADGDQCVVDFNGETLTFSLLLI